MAISQTMKRIGKGCSGTTRPHCRVCCWNSMISCRNSVCLADTWLATTADSLSPTGAGARALEAVLHDVPILKLDIGYSRACAGGLGHGCDGRRPSSRILTFAMRPKNATRPATPCGNERKGGRPRAPHRTQPPRPIEEAYVSAMSAIADLDSRCYRGFAILPAHLCISLKGMLRQRSK